MDGAELHQILNTILRDLEWPSLRARYLEMKKYPGVWSEELGRGHFGFRPYASAGGLEKTDLWADAKMLDDLPRFDARRRELSEFGIKVRVHTFSESGSQTLDLSVVYDERGRLALEELAVDPTPMPPSQ